jgi:hypothetical protein
LETKSSKIGDEAVNGVDIEVQAPERAAEGDQVFHGSAVCNDRISAQAANVEVGEEPACHVISCTACEPSGPPKFRSSRQLLRAASINVVPHIDNGHGRNTRIR